MVPFCRWNAITGRYGRPPDVCSKQIPVRINLLNFVKIQLYREKGTFV